MITFEGLSENFRFLVLEVSGQLRATHEFMRAPTRELFDRITGRDDYIDNLKTIIENKCFSRIHTDNSLDRREIHRIRAIHTIAVNLERIADFCVNILGQMAHLSDPGRLRADEYDPIFTEIEASLNRIIPALEKEDLPAALAICRSEYELDRLYEAVFHRILAEMSDGRSVHDRITTIFIFRYLERIGDSLLNVGEALIFSVLGEKIKIKQFEALQKTLSTSGFGDSLSDIDFRSIWGTRSGCRIGRVERVRGARNSTGDAEGGGGPSCDTDVGGGNGNPAQTGPDGQPRPAPGGLGSIYKQGNKKKIIKERDNIARWSTLFPNLVPEIFGYHEDDDSAALLVEFLQGCTMDEIVLTGDVEILQNAMFVLLQTLHEIWEKTATPGPVDTDFMRQMRSRMESVLQVHPGLRREGVDMCGAGALSTEQLIDRCEAIEKTLPAPFTVFIHGDFNVNNLVYDHTRQAVRFIDLYRSRDCDYVQDISVFLVSNYRLPVFEPALRERIRWVMREFLLFAIGVAAERGDATFQARLALALARSLYTSTRFELNHHFAKDMYLRSHYLMERIVAHGGSWESFRLPAEVLDCGCNAIMREETPCALAS
ncbi:PhoU domain-containing protein [Nitratidesulfovibrio liaohensis]|uniref:PhoU domain-containing protein n=1 Tax=Nitratidesulfovibrio liaohensis TaxID=2604158 RepID=UPI00141FF6DD|nr:PhoU domain-containing protein [Nitratidesulfovibrio liaohensis]NHZ47151.1 phosphotransferase [Nitratidesulfovibrio liaohensis]